MCACVCVFVFEKRERVEGEGEEVREERENRVGPLFVHYVQGSGLIEVLEDLSLHCISSQALTSPLKDPLRIISPCSSRGEGSLSLPSISTRFSEGKTSPMMDRKILAIFDCSSSEQ